MKRQKNQEWIWNWLAVVALGWISFSFVSTMIQGRAVAEQARQMENIFTPRPTPH